MFLSTAAEAFIMLLCLDDFRLKGILITHAANHVCFCFLILILMQSSRIRRSTPMSRMMMFACAMAFAIACDQA